MQLVVQSASYNAAVNNIIALLGTEVDCALCVKDGKAYFEASNTEAYLKTPLKLNSCEGAGKVFTKIEYMKALKPKLETFSIDYNGEDHIAVIMGRARGGIRTLEEEDTDIEVPEDRVKLSAVLPANLINFSSNATFFRPLIDASSPNVIINVEGKEFNISAYDQYMGTHYGISKEDIQTKAPFHLTVDMAFWKLLSNKMGKSGTIKMGADDRYFRIKCEMFDLYHAVMQEDSQDVKEVIDTVRSKGNPLVVVEFDGNAIVEAMEATKGIIQSGDKEGARFFIAIKKEGLAILSAESTAGEVEAEFDVAITSSAEEDVEFAVHSNIFSDILKLTRDDALKYGPARMTVLEDHIVMESLKVPSSSISPVLQD